MSSNTSYTLVELSGVYLPKGTELIPCEKGNPLFPYNIHMEPNQYHEPSFSIPNWEDEPWNEKDGLITGQPIWDIHLMAIGDGVSTPTNAIDFVLENLDYADLFEGFQEQVVNLLSKRRDDYYSKLRDPLGPPKSDDEIEMFSIVTLWSYTSHYYNTWDGLEYDKEWELMGTVDIDRVKEVLVQEEVKE